MSSVSHYSSRNTKSLERVFTDDASVTRAPKTQNLRVVGSEPEEFEGGEVRDRLETLADFTGFFSKLAWGDTMRNAVVLEEIVSMEPLLVLDLGCGEDHPVGRCIAAQELDTHYVGVDADRDRVARVVKEKAPRSFAGVEHDLREPLPIKDGVADYVVCMATLNLFCTTRKELAEFLDECSRTLVDEGVLFLSAPIRDNGGSGDAPVQHPHIHLDEFDMYELNEGLYMAGFDLSYVFNYRARPAVLRRIRRRAEGHVGDAPVIPSAMSQAILLPKLTFNAPVPGNVLIRAEKVDREKAEDRKKDANIMVVTMTGSGSNLDAPGATGGAR